MNPSKTGSEAPDTPSPDATVAQSSYEMAKPIIYSLVIALVAVSTYLYKLRTDGIFACPAHPYTDTNYLAYCQAGDYGDYDHGAFLFSLEPEAEQNMRAADVLFLGNSRMQFGMSTNAVDNWFEQRSLDYYLLGFSNTENSQFQGPLLQRLQPRAHAYVINVDRFFTHTFTSLARNLMFGEGMEEKTKTERRWQAVHRPLCTALPWICGERLAFFRDVHRGQWTFWQTPELVPSGIDVEQPTRMDDWPTYVAEAEQFIDQLGVSGDCLIFTMVPSGEMRLEETNFIMDKLGLPLVSPEVSDLQTLDGSHLNSRSAEHWSSAFLAAAGPSIERCLGKSPRGGKS